MRQPDSPLLRKYAKVAETRSQVYGFLSAMYLELPDLSFIRKIFSVEFERSLSSAVTEMDSKDIAEGLRLIGNFTVSFKDQPEEESLRQVRLPENWTGPPDYIGIELDFMRLICMKEEEAWRRGLSTEALKYLEAEN